MSTSTDLDTWEATRAAAARTVTALLGRADEVPDTGDFVALAEGFAVEHPEWKAGRVELRLGATPRLTRTGTEPTDGRHVDVCVLTRSGGSETIRTILRGSKAEVIEALRSLEVPRTVVTTMRELAITQRRFDLP